MKDSVDDQVEMWAAVIADIDPRTEGIVTRMQRIVRYLGARKAVQLEGLGLQV